MSLSDFSHGPPRPFVCLAPLVLDPIGCGGGGGGMVDLATLLGTGVVRGARGVRVGSQPLSRQGSFGCSDADVGSGVAIGIDHGPAESTADV